MNPGEYIIIIFRHRHRIRPIIPYNTSLINSPIDQWQIIESTD